MARPWKVGLTGGIGSGKTQVASMFAALGVPVIDADTISRNLTAEPGPVLQQISDQISPSVLDETGRLNRTALRNIVFADPDARRKLEAILHPHVYACMEQEYQLATGPYCIFSIPLLLETDARHRVDRLLVVDCPVEMQIERAANRDKVSRQVIEAIIRSQVSREQRLAAADDVILNDGSIDELETRVVALHRSYLQQAGNRPG